MALRSVALSYDESRTWHLTEIFLTVRLSHVLAARDHIRPRARRRMDMDMGKSTLAQRRLTPGTLQPRSARLPTACWRVHVLHAMRLVVVRRMVDADGRALTQVEGTTAADAHVE